MYYATEKKRVNKVGTVFGKMVNTDKLKLDREKLMQF